MCGSFASPLTIKVTGTSETWQIMTVMLDYHVEGSSPKGLAKPR